MPEAKGGKPPERDAALPGGGTRPAEQQLAKLIVEYNVTACGNCDTELHPSNARLFCGDACHQLASAVRYARATRADGRIWEPDVYEAILIKIGHAVAGGYPTAARQLTKPVRDAVIERDGGHCCNCGEPGTEIDHIRGSSAELDNLQLLCTECHRKKTMSSMRRATQAETAVLQSIWKDRIESRQPARLCDDPDVWSETEKQLRRLRRDHLEALMWEEDIDPKDIPGRTWAEKWDAFEDEVADRHAVDDPEAMMYLYEVMNRDD